MTPKWLIKNDLWGTTPKWLKETREVPPPRVTQSDSKLTQSRRRQRGGQKRQHLPSSLGALDATSKVPCPMWRQKCDSTSAIKMLHPMSVRVAVAPFDLVLAKVTQNGVPNHLESIWVLWGRSARVWLQPSACFCLLMSTLASYAHDRGLSKQGL